MLSPALRALLIAGSLLTLMVMLNRIRVSKMQIYDAVFWIIFLFSIVTLSIFPDAATWCSRLLGFSAPINFVFLFIIFILLVKLFTCSIRISQLDAELKQLTQRVAIDLRGRDETDGREE